MFRENLSDDILAVLNSPAVVAERDAFFAQEVRPDREYWRGLLLIKEPDVLI